jgi:hypothetical protein
MPSRDGDRARVCRPLAPQSKPRWLEQARRDEYKVGSSAGACLVMSPLVEPEEKAVEPTDTPACRARGVDSNTRPPDSHVARRPKRGVTTLLHTRLKQAIAPPASTAATKGTVVACRMLYRPASMMNTYAGCIVSVVTQAE